MKRQLTWKAIFLSIIGVAAIFVLLSITVRTTGASTEYAVNVLPPVKAKMLADEAKARANASRAPKPAHPTPPAPILLPPRVGGIFYQRSGPFSGAQFEVRNEWDGAIGGTWLTVFAGGPTVDGAPVPIGGIRIYSSPIDPNSSVESAYLGDWKSSLKGALIIDSVKGKIMTLENEVGTKIAFDLVNKLFS